MKNKCFVGAIVLLLICLVAMGAFADFTDDVMYVGVRPDTYLREDPSADNPYLARMPYGSTVTVFFDEIGSDDDTWSYINYNGQRGYCRAKYLQADDPFYGEEAHPTSQAEAFGGNLLQKGNKTPDYRVRNLQLCLIEAGYLDSDPGADGYFGNDTYQALKDYQTDNQMDAVGRAGDTTKTVLWKQYKDFLSENGVMQ